MVGGLTPVRLDQNPRFSPSPDIVRNSSYVLDMCQGSPSRDQPGGHQTGCGVDS